MRIPCVRYSDRIQTDFRVLWLDVAKENTSLSSSQKKKVRSLIKNWKEFETEEDCQVYIHSALLTEKIVLIASETLAKNVVPSVHQQCQIAIVFVYHDTEELDHHWGLQYKKVKFVELAKLENHIKWFQCRWARHFWRDFLPKNIFDMEHVGIERSTTDMNGSYLCSQLLRDTILRIKSSSSDKDKFISTYAKLFKGRTEESKDLKDFNINYQADDAVEWYTKDTFIFRFLNRALRIQNIEFLVRFGFYIRDLEKQIEKHQCSYPVHVYRGQLMSKNELSHLQQSIGKFISMNSFLSTTLIRSIAFQFIGVTDNDVHKPTDDSEPVLFEIDADPNLDGGVPAFANVADFSGCEAEEEVLFSSGSVFRLNNVRRDSTNPYLSIVSMTLCSNDDHGLKNVFDAMKKEYQEDDTETNHDDQDPTLISLGIVLLNMGYLKLAKKFFVEMLRTLQDKSPSVNIARCYHYIGDVYRQKTDFIESRKQYRKALNIYTNVLPENHALIAATYMCLGHAYSKTTDWKFSAWYRTDFSNWWETHLSNRWQKSLVLYNKALTIYKQIYGEERACSRIAACYLSIGSAYFNSHAFIQAIDNYQKALEIEENLLPPPHPALAYCHSKLALAFLHTDENADARKHYEIALEIGLKSLPAGHPLIIEIYYVLGNICKDMGDVTRSDDHFRMQLLLLDSPETSAPSMVDVGQVFGGKMHYLCPRCRLPVWVYPSCRIFKGKTCARCLREILHLRPGVRVTPL